MTNTPYRKKYFLFSLPCDTDNIKTFCKKNRDVIVDKLLKQNIILTSFDNSDNYFLSTKTKLTYLPHKFDIIIKNSKIYFYLIEDDI